MNEEEEEQRRMQVVSRTKRQRYALIHAAIKENAMYRRETPVTPVARHSAKRQRQPVHEAQTLGEKQI